MNKSHGPLLADIPNHVQHDAVSDISLSPLSIGGFRGLGEIYGVWLLSVAFAFSVFVRVSQISLIMSAKSRS